MVKTRLLLFTVVVTLFFGALAETVKAQRQYHLEHEWTKISINRDGTIDLLYDISITLDSGPDINFVNVGQPVGDFTIGKAMDQYGHTLATSDASSGTDFKIRVNMSSPLRAGQTLRFNVTTNVAHMIWEDSKNPGNVGMQFTPTWWQEAMVLNLRVLIVLPPGVPSDKIATSENWDNLLTEDGRFAVYWERQNLAPDQRYTFGLSFPKEYVENYERQPTGLVAFFQKYGVALLVFGFFAVLIGGVVIVARKRPYLIPKLSMETLGIRHGFTAVEAAYLLSVKTPETVPAFGGLLPVEPATDVPDFKPTKLVTMMLFSLLHKRAVWVESTDPSLKIRIMEPFKDKKGPAETLIQYYEIDFLNAIREDGTLDEEKLAQAIMFLRDTVEEKMRGYCRRDTIEYYRSIVAKAWTQVEQAGTTELASKAYDEQLLWLFLDPNYRTRTDTVFRDRVFEPSPLWLWYWYSYQHYHPHPTYKPNVESPTQASKPPTIPGADFANNIATAVENTSNNIVSNLEKFASAILPASASAKASHEPAHHRAGCVCACAACACACACVSCACACAGGGVG